jgi:hypothetical protein
MSILNRQWKRVLISIFNSFTRVVLFVVRSICLLRVFILRARRYILFWRVVVWNILFGIAVRMVLRFDGS